MAASMPSRPNGQRATSVAHLSHVGLELFFERGFDETTVDDIAEAAGIGRRTFFRYFPSKNDLPWGDFDALLDRMRADLAAVPEGTPMVDALRSAILDFNRYPDEELDYLRKRMQLLLNVPSLVAHSALRYAAWRAVVAEFAGRRLGVSETDLGPQVVAWACLAACLAAYEQWLLVPEKSLLELLDSSMTQLRDVFGTEGP